jgi:hypothetical protein
VGIVVTLEVDGKPVTVPDPSGGSCDAAGDFDRLLPFSADLPVLSRIDPYDTVILRGDDLGQLAVEVDRVSALAAAGPERRGLARLRALAQEGTRRPGSVLRVSGD